MENRPVKAGRRGYRFREVLVEWTETLAYAGVLYCTWRRVALSGRACRVSRRVALVRDTRHPSENEKDRPNLSRVRRSRGVRFWSIT